jgi:TRAP-type C4-dicarboxylate transport system permease large subunit
VKFILFLLTGLMSGVAAICLTSRLGSTRPSIATGWELEVVTMVVLGGVNILGGSGTIPGAVIAAFVMGLVTFGLGLLNVPGIVMSIVIGALLIGVIWGGIYGGLFTATEAGAIGTLLAFLLLIYRRSIRTAWRNIADAIPDAVQATAMIFVTMIAAMLFSKYLTVLGVFDGMLRGMSATGMPPIVTVLIIFAVIMIMGMFMVAMAVLLITAPIATAILVPLGYDPLWIGIMMILLFELANITPPIGLNTYVVKGIAPEVPMADIFKGSGIFIVMIVLLMVLLTIFPGIVTWLPNTLR